MPDHAPVVAGTASVGRTLTVTPGSYNATPDTLGYRWLRDGVPIAGATTGSYTLTSNDLGADITVEVTATKAGYVDAVDTSDPVGPVARGALSAPTASITGTAQVGQTLTAAPTGGYGYRWFRNDAPIPGAHGATYLLTADDLDAVIAVEVTASSPGYPDAADVSDPVGPVPRAPSPPARSRARSPGPSRSATR